MSEPFGEILTNLPNWLILHIAQPVGQRMPKLKKWHENLSRAPRHRHACEYPRYIVPYDEVAAPEPRVPKSYKRMGMGGWKTGNLQENEYPFWVGEEDATGTWARCRWCGTGQVASTKDSRTAHQGIDNCTKNLRIVYKLSLSTESYTRCVMCEKGSTRRRWGTALCSIECDNGFRFKLLLSPRMKVLRELAQKLGLLYPMINEEWQKTAEKMT